MREKERRNEERNEREEYEMISQIIVLRQSNRLIYLSSRSSNRSKDMCRCLSLSFHWLISLCWGHTNQWEWHATSHLIDQQSAFAICWTEIEEHTSMYLLPFFFSERQKTEKRDEEEEEEEEKGNQRQWYETNEQTNRYERKRLGSSFHAHTNRYIGIYIDFDILRCPIEEWNLLL